MAGRARLAEEIVPVPVPPAFDRVVTLDNGVRENQTTEALAKLKPFFDRKFGTVTAGNSSQITDGGAAVVVASEEFVKKQGLTPLGRIVGWGFAGLEPERMGLGPVALDALRAEEGRPHDEGDRPRRAQRGLRGAGPRESPGVREGSRRSARSTTSVLNVNGGAIALGHPVGASGTRLILTLLLEMRRRKVSRGLATLCVGGGQGASILLEAA